MMKKKIKSNKYLFMNFDETSTSILLLAGHTLKNVDRCKYLANEINKKQDYLYHGEALNAPTAFKFLYSNLKQKN